MVVEGEPGIGKSALVRHVTALVPGRTVLTGQCHPVREPLAFAPFLDALSGAPPTRDLNPVTGALHRLLPELAEWLPPALPDLGRRPGADTVPVGPRGRPRADPPDCAGARFRLGSPDGD